MTAGWFGQAVRDAAEVVACCPEGASLDGATLAHLARLIADDAVPRGCASGGLWHGGQIADEELLLALAEQWALRAMEAASALN